MAPRKAHVGHGDACREVTLTSPPLSFICAACIIRPSVVLSEGRSREYIERSWLVSLGGLRMKKIHGKVWFSCENSKGKTMALAASDG